MADQRSHRVQLEKLGEGGGITEIICLKPAESG